MPVMQKLDELGAFASFDRCRPRAATVNTTTFYGLLTWLNRDGRMFADASRASWFMFGAGGNTVWIDPDSEAVVVTRWLDGAHSAGFVSRVVQALGS